MGMFTNPDNFFTWKTSMINTLGAITSPSDISTAESEISDILGCVNSTQQKLASASSDLTTLQKKYTDLKSTFQDGQKDLDISKERVKFLTRPVERATIHDAWFPLDRPLQTSSMLLILVLALFGLTLFFGMVMYQFGFFVQLGFIVPWFVPSGPTPLVTPLRLGLVVAALTIYSLVLYYSTKK